MSDQTVRDMGEFETPDFDASDGSAWDGSAWDGPGAEDGLGLSSGGAGLEDVLARQAPSRLFPWVIATLIGLAGATAFAALLAPGWPSIIMLVGCALVAVVALFGLASGAMGVGPRPLEGEVALRVLDEVTEAYLVTRSDGSVLYANKAYRTLLGQLGAPVGEPLSRALADRNDAAEALYRLERAARGGLSAREEIALAPPTGAAHAPTGEDDRLWLRIQVDHLNVGRGRTLWRVADAGPIRAKEERLHGLEKARADLSRLVESVPAAVVTAGEDGRLAYLNERFEALAGYDDGALRSGVGVLALEDLFGEGELDKLRSAAEAGRLETLRRIKVRAREGRPVAVRLLSVGGRPTADGFHIDALLLGEAIEGAHAEAALESLSGGVSLESVLEAAPVAALLLDAQGKVCGANTPAVLLGKDAVDQGPGTAEPSGLHLGARFLDLVAEDDREKVQTLLTAARESTAPAEGMECRLRLRPAVQADADADENGARSDPKTDKSRTDKTSMDEEPEWPVLQLFVGLLDRPGTEGLVSVFLVDASERKTLEQQFAQAQKMQAVGQLAGGVAHDFNNILTAIIGNCDLLLEKLGAGDPAFQELNMIKQNAVRAANLTRQLLAFSRRQTLRPTVLKTTELVADLDMMLKRTLGEKVKLQIHHERGTGLIKADRSQMENVIINLAVNARDAMPDGGSLTIRTRNISEAESKDLGYSVVPPADYVLIEVADTGTGIPKDIIGKIFEPFFTTKKVGEGTGLGLSTVYGIVKQTGGFIFPESEMGKGTVFKILLPRHRVEAGEEAETETVAAAPRDLTGAGTVLLVEDELAVRLFAKKALTSRGYKVLEAVDGENALELADAHDGAIDLVISDVVMPNMDGPTLVKALRERRPEAHIVFISGYAESAFRKSLDNPEEFDFLPKPFTLEELATKVKDVLSRAA